MTIIEAGEALLTRLESQLHSNRVAAAQARVDQDSIRLADLHAEYKSILAKIDIALRLADLPF